MKRRNILLCYLLACTFLHPLSAQTTDSLRCSSTSANTPRITQLWNSKFYRMSHIAVPLIVIGSIANNKDKGFGEMRNSYIPRFSFHYDDILQYTPGIIMLGLKSAGVEGRSSWGRMLTSDAFAVGIMAITVNSLKQTVIKERPDHSSKNSFPSGHTATAFMLATMLHKEYGVTRSPLYSVLGYSIATATAVSRQLNNKHWFSDVLTGAGIGILSTELGYYLADLIFKKKGLVRPLLSGTPNYDRYFHLGIQMGYGIGEREMHLPEGIEIEGYGGVTSSLHGGWFFNRHWGIAGKFSISQVSPTLNTSSFFNHHPEMKPLIREVEVRSMTYTSLMAGIQYDQRIIPNLHIGASIMPGIGWTGTYRINVIYKNDETSSPLIHCQTHPIPNLDLSVYLMRTMDKNLGFRIFANYNMGKGKGDYNYYTPNSGKPIITAGHTNLYLHHFTIGAEVDALLWK